MDEDPVSEMLCYPDYLLQKIHHLHHEMTFADNFTGQEVKF